MCSRPKFYIFLKNPPLNLIWNTILLRMNINISIGNRRVIWPRRKRWARWRRTGWDWRNWRGRTCRGSSRRGRRKTTRARQSNWNRCFNDQRANHQETNQKEGGRRWNYWIGERFHRGRWWWGRKKGKSDHRSWKGGKWGWFTLTPKHA